MELQRGEIIIKELKRIGKAGTTPQPLWIQTSNREEKDTILKKARNLGKVNQELGTRISVRQDMTHQQRLEQSKLMRELKDRRAAGGDWTIFKKKVVSREEKEKRTERQPFRRQGEAPSQRGSK